MGVVGDMTGDERSGVLSMALPWPLLWGLCLGLVLCLEEKVSRISVTSSMVWMRLSPQVQAFEHLAPSFCYCLGKLRRYGLAGSSLLLQRVLRFESMCPFICGHYHHPPAQLPGPSPCLLSVPCHPASLQMPLQPKHFINIWSQCFIILEK